MKRLMGLVLLAMSALLLAAAAASAQENELTLCLTKPNGKKATIETPYSLGDGDVLTASDAAFFLSTGGDFSIIDSTSSGSYHISLGACSTRSSTMMSDVDHAFACAGQPSAGLPGVWAVFDPLPGLDELRTGLLDTLRTFRERP